VREIFQNLVAPLRGICDLNSQALGDFRVAAPINFAAERLPASLQYRRLFRAFLIPGAKFRPQCSAGFQSIVPWAAMKPQEIFFRTAPDIVEHIANRRKVLLDRSVTAPGAIEADAFG
jgi:hypothetical protein